jgi:hypothetical protein
VAKRPGGQEARWPGGQVARWPGGQVARWPGGQVARWPGGQVARWPGGQVARWPGGQVARWPGVQVARSLHCTAGSTRRPTPGGRSVAPGEPPPQLPPPARPAPPCSPCWSGWWPSGWRARSGGSTSAPPTDSRGPGTGPPSEWSVPSFTPSPRHHSTPSHPTITAPLPSSCATAPSVLIVSDSSIAASSTQGAQRLDPLNLLFTMQDVLLRCRLPRSLPLSLWVLRHRPLPVSLHEH